MAESDGAAHERKGLGWDRFRAGLGVTAALAAVALKAAGKAGVVIVGAVALLQWLNMKLWRRHSASLTGGRDRFAAQPAAPGGPHVPRAELIFLLEERASLGTSLWLIVLLCWTVGIPVHPLMYSVMLLLVALVVLLQQKPQLRVRRATAPRRPLARPPSEGLR